MFQPLENCLSCFVMSCSTTGYPDITITNYRIEREGDKMFIFFEADLHEDKK